MASAQITGTPNYDESKKLLEIFCKYFVTLYELKLEAYTMFVDGKSKKAGKFADFYSKKLGQGAGAGLAFLLPPLSAVAKLGNSIAEPIGKQLGRNFHGDKVNSVLHLLEYWRNDKPGFREKLVEAALDLGQSFEMQFMFIKVEVGGYREALRLVALDSVNRSFNCYEKFEKSIEQMTISESVLRGNSKIETVLGMPIDVKYIKTPGSTIYYRNQSNAWLTSSLFEKSGVVIVTDNSKTYYKLKINSRTSKYGYRRLLKSEIAKWSKLCENYEKEPDLSETAQFTDYNYKFSLDSDKFSEIQNFLLDHVNEKDPKLQEERVKNLLTEIEESILHEIQTLIDTNEIDHNLLVDMKEYLTEFSSDILNNIVEMLQLQRNLLEVTNKNQQETVSSFNSANEERHKFADDNKNYHVETQRLVVELFDQSKSVGSKASLPIKYNINCSLNYIKRYNANGVCKTDEINSHFYPNYVSSNDSKIPIPIVIICGLGGVGKSEEARNYCKFWLDEGIDRTVLWIDCTTITSFVDTFKSFGFELTIWAHDNVPKADKDIVNAIYSYFLNRETLFVFDNADEHVQEFLPQIVTLSLHEGQKLPYILMTSRTKLWDGEGSVTFQLVELGVFTDQEGLHYVKDCLGLSQEETANDKDILDLYKLFSLPLALRQAVAFIKAEKSAVGQCTITKCITEYNTNGKKLLNFLPYKNDEKRYSHSVLTTWLITLDKIKTQPGGKAAQEILNILAYLYPNAIDLYKILDISSEDDKNRDLKAGIQLLSKYSLIDLGSDQRAYIHALVQDVIRIQLKKVSVVWLGALCLLSFSLLFIIVNAFFGFGSKLSEQLALALVFISFPYVVSTSFNTEERTLGKVLNLLNSKKISRDCDTLDHAIEAWYYSSKYFKLVFKHYFVIENLYPLNVSIQRYGPLHDTPLHILSLIHSKSAYNLLWYLSFLRKLPKFKELIVNATNDAGVTSLHEVCSAHSLDFVRMADFLIKQGANIEAVDAEGKTPLHVAVYWDKVHMANFLIKQGANIETVDVKGKTPLHTAVYWDKVDMAEFLIKQGAKIEVKDKKGNTPLHIAVYWDKIDMAESLINQGANIEAVDGEGKTPLHIAVYWDKVDISESLINQGASIEAVNVDGRTPLHIAVYWAKVDMVESLIKHGANIKAEDVKGKTPLHIAAVYCDVGMAEYLINQGAQIEAVDKERKTPLHLAACYDKLDMAKFLINQSALIEAVDEDGRSPLHHAVHIDEVDMAEFLIKQGANIEAEDINGKTPLNIAEEKSFSDMTKLLWRHRAHGNAKNCDEDSLFHNNLENVAISE